MRTLEAQGGTWLVEGERLLAARELRRATQAFHHAEALGIDADRCSAGRWMVAMLAGQFEEAWRESDAIRRRGTPDPYRFWQEESIAGKRVILRCLHGFGDAVQFLRYAPQLQSVATNLIVEVPPRFLDLARCFDGVGEVVTWGDQAPTRSLEGDVQVEVMELPYLFRTQLCALPIASKYLHLPQCDPLPSKTPFLLQVGLVWTAGLWNPARALPFSLLQPLTATRGCEFWDLQEVADGTDQQHYPSKLREHFPCRRNIMGLAATISQLDLVITVDTLAAHLAGALGIPAWVLLQYEADWRWMCERSDSPWYPSLRLFRQPVPGDWPSVIANVCRALCSYTGSADRRGAA